MGFEGEITVLLQDIDAGKDGAMDKLMDAVYEDLERMANWQLRKQFGSRAGKITLEPAALVNEFYLKLIKQRSRYDNRGHFFSIATRIMLRILIDYRRKRQAAKRGGGNTHITLVLDEHQVAGKGRRTDVIEIEQLAASLKKLEALDARKADVVKMRVLWGLDLAQTAESLAVSSATVERDWRFAKAWLAEQMPAQ